MKIGAADAATGMYVSMLRRTLEAFALPPLSCLVLAAAGVAVLRRKPRTGRGLLIASGVLLAVSAMPLVGTGLLCTLQRREPVDVTATSPAQAIVVLSADWESTAPEFGHATVSALTLQRVRYGAVLQRATGLPLLMSGGAAEPGAPALAELMRDVATGELDVPVRWVETKSQDTYGNAVHSAELLRAANVTAVYLVTHAWHMPRAQRAFEAAGLEVIPAPTAFRSVPSDVLRALLPHWDGLRDTSRALHEYLGYVYYELFCY